MTFEHWWKENNFTFPRLSAHLAQVAKDIARAAWYAEKVVSSILEHTTQHGAIEGKKAEEKAFAESVGGIFEGQEICQTNTISSG